MLVIIQGQLLKCEESSYVSKKNNEEIKVFSLHVYDGKNVQQISVPVEMYNKYFDKVNEEVVIECSVFIKGFYNLYVKKS